MANAQSGYIKQSSLLTGLLCMAMLSGTVRAAGPDCLFVSSYHQGNPWSDGIEDSLRSELGDHCDIHSVYLDGDRQPAASSLRRAALEVVALARKLQPDVIITADDAAAQYLIEPHLSHGRVPIVFSGIDWSLDHYVLPEQHVTGMVELAPVRYMLFNALAARQTPATAVLNQPSRARHTSRILYLGSESHEDLQMLSRVTRIASSANKGVDSILVSDFDAWLRGFRYAQDYDLLVLGSNIGIRGFDSDVARRHAHLHTRTLSVTSHPWMMDYSVLGFVRIAEEHGHWAALSAKAILDGLSPSDIPVTTNRRYENWINPALIESSSLQIFSFIAYRAKRHR